MVIWSEIIVTAASWALMAIGGFFALRGAVRRKKLKRTKRQDSVA